MPRITGVDIPDNKPVRIALRYIHGIGETLADHILEKVSIDGQRKAKELSEDDIAHLTQYIEDNYVVEGSLRRQVQQNIQRLREIKCYKGERHRRGLPVHGQRTRTNARTRKGKKKTVAGKKGVAMK